MKEQYTHLGLARTATWLHLYPACKEKLERGTIWLETTIIPTRVTCPDCIDTDIFRKRLMTAMKIKLRKEGKV